MVGSGWVTWAFLLCDNCEVCFYVLKIIAKYLACDECSFNQFGNLHATVELRCEDFFFRHQQLHLRDVTMYIFN